MLNEGKGQDEKGQDEKGQDEKGQDEKGQDEKGQDEKGQDEKVMVLRVEGKQNTVFKHTVKGGVIGGATGLGSGALVCGIIGSLGGPAGTVLGVVVGGAVFGLFGLLTGGGIGRLIAAINDFRENMEALRSAIIKWRDETFPKIKEVLNDAAISLKEVLKISKGNDKIIKVIKADAEIAEETKKNEIKEIEENFKTLENLITGNSSATLKQNTIEEMQKSLDEKDKKIVSLIKQLEESTDMNQTALEALKKRREKITSLKADLKHQKEIVEKAKKLQKCEIELEKSISEVTVEEAELSETSVSLEGRLDDSLLESDVLKVVVEFVMKNYSDGKTLSAPELQRLKSELEAFVENQTELLRTSEEFVDLRLFPFQEKLKEICSRSKKISDKYKALALLAGKDGKMNPNSFFATNENRIQDNNHNYNEEETNFHGFK